MNYYCFITRVNNCVIKVGIWFNETHNFRTLDINLYLNINLYPKHLYLKKLKEDLNDGSWTLCRSKKTWAWLQQYPRQECIPVGCVLPTAVAIPEAGTTPQAPPRSRHPPSQIPLNFPLGCGPGPDPPQFPPWLWAWTRSPPTSPLGVGLETPPARSP